jgi:hypothetical protein
METTRRGFLKVLGVGSIVAAVPISLFTNEVIAKENANIVVTNLNEGTEVWIKMRKTGKEIFRGISDDSGILYIEAPDNEEIIFYSQRKEKKFKHDTKPIKNIYPITVFDSQVSFYEYYNHDL